MVPQSRDFQKRFSPTSPRHSLLHRNPNQHFSRTAVGPQAVRHGLDPDRHGFVVVRVLIEAFLPRGFVALPRCAGADGSSAEEIGLERERLELIQTTRGDRLTIDQRALDLYAPEAVIGPNPARKAAVSI